MPNLRSRFAPVVVFVIGFVAIATLTRAALLVRVLAETSLPPATIARVFAAGLGFDSIAALYAAAVFAFLIALVPDRVYRSRPVRLSAHALAIGGLFVLIFAAIAEWFFWGEFSARFNFIAVDYLVYTREVLDNIVESYPVLPLVATAFVVALVGWGIFLRPVLAESFEGASTLPGRLSTAALILAVPLLSFFLTDTRLPRIAEERQANELGSNGLYNLFSAFRNNQLDYAPFYATADAREASSALHDLLAEPGAIFQSGDPLNLTREVHAHAPERKLNVIVVVVESLSASFLGAFGNEDALTPNLDRLSRQGLLFTKLYATGTRTVRGLEAVTLSVPPTPGYSIVKRRDNANLFSIGSVFRERGYRTSFFYGGYAFFDNMGAFFGGNGFEVIDRAALAADESEFSNAWGVADEFVFKRVLREARRSHDKGESFLSVVMTTSNHRPFTYPDGRIDIASGESRAGAVKYTDFAIGKLIDEARREPWFDETVFVIVADHCASSAGELEIAVDDYHIPMLVLAPAVFPAKRVEILASQMDVTPTLLALLDWSYTSRFFGRDILSTPPGNERALLGTYQNLGYLKDDLLTVLSPGRRIDVYRVQPDGNQIPVTSRTAGARVDQAIAFYQSASAAFERPATDTVVARGPGRSAH